MNVRPGLPTGIWPGRDFIVFPLAISTWALAACLFFTPMPSIRAFGQVSLCELLVIIAACVGFIEKILDRQSLFTRKSLLVALVYLFAGLLLSLSYVVNSLDQKHIPTAVTLITHIQGIPIGDSARVLFGEPGSQELFFAVLMFNAVVMPLLLLFFVRISSAAEFRFLVLIWGIGAAFGAAFTIAYCNGLIPTSLYFDRYWVQINRARGLTFHPNTLAIYSMLAVPCFLIFLHERAGLVLRIFSLASLGLMLQAIDYTGSRSCFVGVLLTLAIFLVIAQANMRRRMQMAILVGTLSLLAIGLMNLFSGVVEGWGGVIGRLLRGSYRSDMSRELINTTAWEQALDSPVFGVGYQVLRAAHNLYLQMFHASGFVGFAGYMLLVITPLWLLFTSYFRNLSGQQRIVVSAFLAGLLTMTALAWVKSNPFEFSTAFLYALALIWGVNQIPVSEESHRQWESAT